MRTAPITSQALGLVHSLFYAYQVAQPIVRTMEFMFSQNTMSAKRDAAKNDIFVNTTDTDSIFSCYAYNITFLQPTVRKVTFAKSAIDWTLNLPVNYYAITYTLAGIALDQIPLEEFGLVGIIIDNLPERIVSPLHRFLNEIKKLPEADHTSFADKCAMIHSMFVYCAQYFSLKESFAQYEYNQLIKNSTIKNSDSVNNNTSEWLESKHSEPFYSNECLPSHYREVMGEQSNFCPISKEYNLS